MNIKWYDGCGGPWPNRKSRDGGNLSKHQGSVCAYVSFPPPPFISNAKLRVLTLRVCSSWATKLEVKWVWQCAAVWELPAAPVLCRGSGSVARAQGREAPRGRDNMYLRELCFGEDQGKVLRYTPKQTSVTNLEDRGKQINIFFCIPSKTLIFRNIYTRKTKK